MTREKLIELRWLAKAYVEERIKKDAASHYIQLLAVIETIKEIEKEIANLEKTT